MAKRYALVPESWLSTLNGATSNSVELTARNALSALSTFQNDDVPTTSNNNMFSTPIVDGEVKPNGAKILHLADLLPKNLKARARILLHYLENANVNVNDVQRIIYADGTVGSHILDLVRYTVAPFVKTRPLDWPQFKALLENIGVPEAVFGRKIVEKDTLSPLSRWKPY